MKCILVTGASGFIGRWTIPPLRARGFDVHVLSVDDAHIPGTIVHQANIMDSRAVAEVVRTVRPSHLLHMAWNATPGVYWTTPENLDWVAASLHLYRRFAETGGLRAVIAGSCAEYDWSYPLLDEGATPCAPATLYGISKDALRRLLAEAARLGGPAVAWGRIHFLYGPGEKSGRLVSALARAMLAGEPVDTTAGTQVRDFMHVGDVGAAFAAMCDCAVTGPVNIATGEARPLRDIIEIIANLAGRPDLPRIGARPTPAEEPARLDVAVARLRDEVGFRPRYTLEAGLADTLAWWQHQARGVALGTGQ